MSIKQHGGVFGRNPSFNNVEVESLSIAGNAVPDASTILVDGDIGSAVQGYDANTAKLDVEQSFTEGQTFPFLSVSKNTGTDPVDPAELQIKTTTNGSGWSTTDPWGKLTFFSSDTSTGGAKTHAQIKAICSADLGGYSYLGFDLYNTSSSALTSWMRLQNAASISGRKVVIDAQGGLEVTGSLSKGSGSFKIDHPLKPETHHLVHSFIEGPQAENIYRGTVDLVNGTAAVNLDEAGQMTEGTFAALNGNVQCFTTNEDGWTAVRGSVVGNILTIEAQDNTCTDAISWMVIGERHDQHMIDTKWTDDQGRVIVEPEKIIEDGELE